MRVVSLVPSATETLLGLGVDVVACTRFCEQPGLVHVGGTKDPDVPAIVALAPDLVVVDEEENRREDAEALEIAGLALCVTAVRSVNGALAAVDELAARCDVAAPARPALAPRGPPSRTAVVPIWRRPWMVIGADTYGASLLDRIGVEVVVGSASGRYPVVELAAAAECSPDLVLVPSEPYPFRDRHVAELASAMPTSEVLRIDGQDLFWWGIRTPDAIDRLRSVIDDRPVAADR